MNDRASPPAGPSPAEANGSPDGVAAGLERAREYAALSGPFDPVQALQHPGGAGPADAAKVTAVAAGLSQDCDKVMNGDGGNGWLMRGVTRRRVLDRLAASGGLAAAVERRRATAADEATSDLLDAIDGRGSFAADGIDAAIADADRAALERIVVGLGRAGGNAPRRSDLPRAKAALTRLQLLGSARTPRGGGPPGHQEELERIIRWLDTEFTGGPAITLYVEGLRGVGKSALIEEVAARLLVRDDEWVVVRFDFDRAGLDVQDAVGLTMELARQLATQLPGSEAAIQQARQRAAGTTSGTSPLKGDSPECVPEELGMVLQHALGFPQRRILLVLDDLELLRARGETHPARLFDWLDQLADVTHAPIAVVGAGRGDALGGVHARIGKRIELPGLDDAGAELELERLGVEPSAWTACRAIAKGDPLALRLAAHVATAHGPDALLRAGSRGGMTAAYLYRFLLSQVEDPDLRRIASDAIVVRRLDAEVIRSVVGPRAGLRGLSPERAVQLAGGLARLEWLTEPDPLVTGFIRTRPDLRAALLPLVYESAPAKSARMDLAAARWFGERTEPWAAVEAAYHRLQLMRQRPEPQEIAPSTLARLDAETIAQLPPAAQDLVRRSRGDRSRGFRGAAAPAGTEPDPEAVRELRATNDRSDWLEGDLIYERAFARAALDPRAPEADAALTFLWRSGRWTEARHLLDRQGGWLRTDPSIDEQLRLARLDTICRLEMGAEFQFDAVVDALQQHAPLRDRLAELASEPMLSSLIGGALRFALVGAGVTITRRRAGLDPVGTAAQRWLPKDDDHGSRARGAAIADAAADPAAAAIPAGWERITARTGPIDVRAAAEAVVMARTAEVLTPVADLVDTMSRMRSRVYLAVYATAARPRLDALGNLAPSGSEPWRDALPTGQALALRSLGDLGLLTELIGAAAYVRRDRDLRLVASAAERWRRSVAGAWAYGAAKRRPSGWDRALDVTIADRLAGLLDAADPAALARAHLEAWVPEHANADEVLRLIRERAPASVAAATRAAAQNGAGAAASLLLRRGLPSAFVPAVAVLLDATKAMKEGTRS